MLRQLQPVALGASPAGAASIALVENEATGVTTATLRGFTGYSLPTDVQVTADIPGVPVLGSPSTAIFSSVGLYDSLTPLVQSDFATLQITPFPDGSGSFLMFTFEARWST